MTADADAGVGDRRGPLVAFLGPSLDAGAARAIVPEVVLLPPVTQGDFSTVIERLAPRAVLIVDGEFGQTLSVWHKEILAALVGGTRVVGASSMGALRAAELDRFGMEGIGEIYAHYRDGWLTEDADVALLHGDADSGYQPLTWPLVNVRATVAELVRTGELSDAEGTAVVEAAHRVHFIERTALTVAEALVDAPFDARRGREIAELLRERYVDQKARDAVAGFEHLARLDDIPPPARDEPLHLDGRGFQPLLWSDVAIERGGTTLRRYQLVQDYALHDAEHDALLGRALERELVVWMAHDHGVAPTAAEEAAARTRVLADLGETEETLPDWLAANDLSDGRFTELVRREAIVAHMRQWALGLTLIDRGRQLLIEQLQLEGRYAAAADAAARRRRLLDSRPRPPHPTTEAEIVRLAKRQVVRSGWRPRPDLVTWADEQGFDSFAALLTGLADAEAADAEHRERRARIARLFGIADTGPADPLAVVRGRGTAAGARPGAPTPPAARALVTGPVRVHALLEAHQVSQVVVTAVDLGVPDALVDGPRSVDDLAATIGADPDRLERLLRALAAVGLTTAADGSWSLTPDGRSLLDPADDAPADHAPADHAAADAGPGLAAQARSLRASGFAAWAGLADVIRGADPPGYPSDELEDRAIAASSHALDLDADLVAALPAIQGIGLVDIGGGLGRRAERLLDSRPDLRLAVVELPETARRAAARLAGRGLADRIAVIATDGAEALAEPADVCLLERVIVTLDDAAAGRVLAFAARSLAPGGRVLVVDLRADGTPAAALGDLLNLARSGGGARDDAAWAGLASAAGLRIVETTVVRAPFVRMVMEPIGAGA